MCFFICRLLVRPGDFLICTLISIFARKVSTLNMNLEFNKNEDGMRMLVSQMKQRHAQVSLGGGKKATEKAKEKGKLSPRERIQYLIDKDSEFVEIGSFVGWDMYQEQGGCPSGGTVGGLGYVRSVELWES